MEETYIDENFAIICLFIEDGWIIGIEWDAIHNVLQGHVQRLAATEEGGAASWEDQ
jgi:hypothetical protein